MRHFDDTADLDDRLAQNDQLFGGLDLADELLRFVPNAFRGKVLGHFYGLRTIFNLGMTCGGEVSLPAIYYLTK